MSDYEREKIPSSRFYERLWAGWFWVHFLPKGALRATKHQQNVDIYSVQSLWLRSESLNQKLGISPEHEYLQHSVRMLSLQTSKLKPSWSNKTLIFTLFCALGFLPLCTRPLSWRLKRNIADPTKHQYLQYVVPVASFENPQSQASHLSKTLIFTALCTHAFPPDA